LLDDRLGDGADLDFGGGFHVGIRPRWPLRNLPRDHPVHGQFLILAAAPALCLTCVKQHAADFGFTVKKIFSSHAVLASTMPIKNKRSRRLLVIALLVAGGLLMWLAPEAPAGIALLVAGVVLEIAGITLERRAKG